MNYKLSLRAYDPKKSTYTPIADHTIELSGIENVAWELWQSLLQELIDQVDHKVDVAMSPPQPEAPEITELRKDLEDEKKLHSQYFNEAYDLRQKVATMKCEMEGMRKLVDGRDLNQPIDNTVQIEEGDDDSE